MIQYIDYKEEAIHGRYITMDMLQKHCFPKLKNDTIIIGHSVQGIPIPAFTIGYGKQKVFMWSQMHGNESTTTKAVWDMVNFLDSTHEIAKSIMESCTLMIVPMLNPDGAKAYTRVNHNEVDLNRDAKNLSQPESVALRTLFQKFEPHFCFNLHDQRTLFSAGKVDKPATVSFLSPASNANRDITPSREVAMRLIAAMNQVLQKIIPGQVGRFDDGFNDNCVGDSFQMEKVPTLLFEAGHFQKDYEREKTREFIFHALVDALQTIAKDKISNYSIEDYFAIPENDKLFFDIIVKNPQVTNPIIKDTYRVGIRYKEVLREDIIHFEPELAEMGTLEGFYAHHYIEGADLLDFDNDSAKQDIRTILLSINE
ncbi:MAG: M14 metallopeptidase family protein [Bacteroidota bacterium]|nr:M14 metallopeptidase family protein [Bacteroidota bacterium]